MTSRPTPSAIGFPPDDSPALCVPTFLHDGLKDGEAWCIRAGHVFTLADFTNGKACPGATPMTNLCPVCHRLARAVTSVTYQGTVTTWTYTHEDRLCTVDVPIQTETHP